MKTSDAAQGTPKRTRSQNQADGSVELRVAWVKVTSKCGQTRKWIDQLIAIDIKNSALLLYLPRRVLRSSIASTTFISASTLRRR